MQSAASAQATPSGPHAVPSVLPSDEGRAMPSLDAPSLVTAPPGAKDSPLARPAASENAKPFAPHPAAFPDVTLRLKEMLLEQVAERKATFLKDPAGYAVPMAIADSAPKRPSPNGSAGFSGFGSESAKDTNTMDGNAKWDSFTPEARASRHMAMQTYLARGMEGFTPRVLTAREAKAARLSLADPATDGAAKLEALMTMKESYGAHGDKALEELELAPAVMAAVNLADTAPGFASFAAEIMAEALFCPNPELRKLPREDRLARLYTLAGSNPQARNLIEAMMPPQPGMADVKTMEFRNDRDGTRGPAFKTMEHRMPRGRILSPEGLERLLPGFGGSQSRIRKDGLQELSAPMENDTPPDNGGARQVTEAAVGPEAQQPWEPHGLERAALENLDVKPTPLSPSSNIIEMTIEKQKDEFRQKRIKLYHDDAPKPITDQPVWESGQSRQEWSGKEQPEQKRYYVIGKRPLDIPYGNEFYGVNFGEYKDMEHTQFFANDGSNRGLFEDGFRAEEDKFRHQYAYVDDKRYNAELIDAAMKQAEKEMKKIREEDMYDITDNNCQHYIEKVVNIAEHLSKESGISLFLD